MLYIQVVDGQSINHPAFEENLLDAFGKIPEDWEPFIRVERPALGVYEILESEQPEYQKVDGIWTDVWKKRPMTLEERVVKRKLIKDDFFSVHDKTNFSSWVFDENKCEFIPPTPIPELFVGYEWCGLENTWKVMPPKPTDGQQYKFNYITWSWDPLTS